MLFIYEIIKRLKFEIALTILKVKKQNKITQFPAHLITVVLGISVGFKFSKYNIKQFLFRGNIIQSLATHQNISKIQLRNEVTVATGSGSACCPGVDRTQSLQSHNLKKTDGMECLGFQA